MDKGVLESLKRKQPWEIIELVSNGRQVIVTIILEGLKIEALIDSRAHVNTIDSILVQTQKIPTRKKKELYDLYMANREKHKDRKVETKTKLLTI